MSLWSQSRLIDIMSNIDLSLVAEDFPEQDIEKLNLFPEEKEKWSKKRIAAVTGLAAAGSVAITGVIMLVCRKHGILKKAA
ncbi:MAG TPA: hypothetical protein IAB97_07540 [Candidatus Choladousia intestinipullorum]|nr:hypothetical protein [Candidatus Choladousia intestinipullorum]